MRGEFDGTDPQAGTTVPGTPEGDPDDDPAGYASVDRPWVSTGWGTTDRNQTIGDRAGESAEHDPRG
jgi:hypothetical protein